MTDTSAAPAKGALPGFPRLQEISDMRRRGGSLLALGIIAGTSRSRAPQ